MSQKKLKAVSARVHLAKGKGLSELRFPDARLVIYFDPPYKGSVRWKLNLCQKKTKEK